MRLSRRSLSFKSFGCFGTNEIFWISLTYNHIATNSRIPSPRPGHHLGIKRFDEKFRHKGRQGSKKSRFLSHLYQTTGKNLKQIFTSKTFPQQNQLNDSLWESLETTWRNLLFVRSFDRTANRNVFLRDILRSKKWFSFYFLRFCFMYKPEMLFFTWCYMVESK